MKHSRVLLIPAIIAGLALAGCAGNTATPAADGSSSSAVATSAAPVETPVATVTPTSTPTTASTGAPTSTPTADTTASVITTAGYGDLKLGHPVPSSTKLVAWKPKECYEGRWTTPGITDVKKDPITVRTSKNGKTDPISFIIVNDESVKTKSGAHIGTSAAELKKLFPSAKSTKPSDDITLVAVADSAGQVDFEVEGGVVAGILVQPASAKPTIFLHGDVFGPCYEG